MVEIQTIIIYSMLFLVMYVLCRQTRITGKMFFLFIALILYSIIFGLRYGVGVDFFGYLDNYQYLLKTGHLLRDREIGFDFFTKVCSSLNFSSGLYFGIIAFLQVFLIFYTFRKSKYIYEYLAITFMLGGVWLSYSNGLRQIIAFCFVVYSLKFVISKSPLKHYLCLFLAVLFHSSAILTFVFYPLLLWKDDWFPSVKWQFILIFISILVMYSGVIHLFSSELEKFISSTSYAYYLEGDASRHILSTDTPVMGLGALITFVLYMILISQSSNIKLYLKSDFFKIAYNLFFCGLLFKNLFFSSQLLGRVNYYFLGFDFIIAAYALYYFYHKKKNLYYISISLYVLTFIALMYRMTDNTALYIFNFQEDLFYLKDAQLNLF